MKKKTYDKAFQRSAAEMVVLDGKNMAEAARDLGINRWTLKNWKNRALKEMGEVKIDSYEKN